VRAAGERTIRVRCATWDQVETFYAEKLRGNTLVVKMPYRPELGAVITVALGLPDGLVFAIDGTVVKVGNEEAGKLPVALRMAGFTQEVRAQLVRLVAEGRGAQAQGDEPYAAPPPEPAPAPADARAATAPPPGEAVLDGPEPRLEDVLLEERAIFGALEATRKRLHALRAHEVLGVAEQADLGEIRRGYFVLTKRFHPDVYGKYRSPAVGRLASDVFIHINRAFDRMRAGAAAAAGKRLVGPAAISREGWLADLDDVAAGASASQTMAAVSVPPDLAANPPPGLMTSPPPASAAAATAVAKAPARLPPRIAEGAVTYGPHAMKETVVKVPAPPGPPLTFTGGEGGPGTGPGPRPGLAPGPGPGPGEEYYDEVSFTTSVRMKALTAEELFEEAAGGPAELAARITSPTDGLAPGEVTPPPPLDPLVPGAGGGPAGEPGPRASVADAGAAIDIGRAHLGAGQWREACQSFAAALRVDPRNRAVRALYHVASALELRAQGDGAGATVQLETALRYDRDCPEARQALGQGVDKDREKKGIFRRLFER
jgi:tetratricopeptide (TPR) repeat protein